MKKLLSILTAAMMSLIPAAGVPAYAQEASKPVTKS